MKSVRRVLHRASRVVFSNKKSSNAQSTSEHVSVQTTTEPADASYTDTSTLVEENPQNFVPLELLLQILEYLPIRTLLDCRLVNKSFKHIIDSVPEIQYRIELHVAGHEDNAQCDQLGAPSRLEALMAHKRVWKNPQCAWQRENIGNWVHDTQNVRFYENVWVRCLKDADVVARARWNSVQCVIFEPKSTGEAISDTWSLKFPFSFEGFAADPAQNLLYLLDSRTVPNERVFRMWTVKLTDGDVISEKLFTIDGPPPSQWSLYILDSLDDLIGVVTFESRLDDRDTGGAVRITLLNNATGETIDSLIRAQLPLAARVGFHILTKTCFVAHIFVNGWFISEVYAFRIDPGSGRPHVRHIATFEYPEAQSNSIHTLGHQTELLGRTRGGSMSRNVPPRPFTVTDADGVSYILRYFAPPGQQLTRIMHIIPNSVFIDAADSSHTGSPIINAWNEWGPTKSRCLLDHSPCILGIYGYKVLLPDFTMLDFNPVSLARDIAQNACIVDTTEDIQQSKTRKALGKILKAGRLQPQVSSSEGEPDDLAIPGTAERIIRRPTVIRKGDMFAEDVVTALPYRETHLMWNGESPDFTYGGEVWIACASDLFEDGTYVKEYHSLRL